MDILAKICADKQEWIVQCKAHTSEAELQAHITDNADTPRGFIQALANQAQQKQTALIAEIKKASPSKGLIREDFAPAALAGAYEKGGATCLSVLTDAPYFQGCDAYLQEARSACTLPALRKDFMLDPYQVTEARALRADCILLIIAALSPAQAQELEQAAHALKMDVLIEVHNEAELETALEHLKSPLLGVNNRNLKTMEIDLATTERLVRQIPLEQRQKRTLVCESGIYHPDDIARMHQSGVYTFLVGESLMRQADVTLATQTLLGAA